MSARYDFIAIGDTVTDAFIRLSDVTAHVDIDHGAKEICFHFGDKVPYESVTVVPGVGNSANAASAAARLGLKTAFVSNVGDDDDGKEIIGALSAEGMDTRFIKVNPGKKTNYHYVLWFHDDRTILIKHEKFDYEMPDVGSPKWLYLSSAGENSLPMHNTIADYLESHKNIKLAFQPGTYQIKFGAEALSRIYKHTEIFFCNRDEAQRILNTKEDDIKKLIFSIHALGPKMVCITDGPAGAYASDGSTIWQMPIYPDPKPPLSRTGAGDAFSSTITAALALGNDLKTALTWGPVNSMSVVQQIGARAGLLSRSQLEKYLAEAPADYEPKLL
ncbi:MAG: carbohydrate kinase family protein [Candidatus Sungbacteria bacterium]|nr:carbohydrate kinase family protein [Candidatus Sungbacteria bacterium]